LVDLATSWQRSTVAEVSWIGPGGPDGLAAVPLVWEGVPCVALPFSRGDVVPALTGSQAAFSVTDVLAGGKVALIASGPVDLRIDIDGSIFVEHLLEQEAVKHPPTRLRADSLIGRRENWWWIPRIIVRLAAVDHVREVHGRTRPQDALLVRERVGQPLVEVVSAVSWPVQVGAAVEVYARDGSLLDGADEPAYVFAHQHSPDFERWERWYRIGRLRGEELTVQVADGVPADSLPPFGLVERYRSHRALARACKAGIASVERSR
jgi:hypothetical protein